MNKILTKIKKILKDNKLEQYFTKKYFNYFLVLFSAMLGFYLNWGVTNIIFFSFLIWVIIYSLPSKTLAKIALICIFLSPIMLILKRNNNAEYLALLAYYFLILATAMSVVELIRAKNTGKKQ